MTDYTKTTDFTSKDSLPSGDSGKIIRGAEFGTEFDNIQTAVNSKSNIDNPSFTGNITVTGTVDGRDIAADGTKLDTVETSADVTDTANVTAAGAVMDSELTDITAVKALDQGVATTDSPTFAAVTSTGNVTVDGTVDGRDVAADGTKLDTVETNADVTDTTNVTAAGALMDSEVTNLDQVKAFDSADYATAAQGTTADNALPKTGGAMTGAITTNSTFDGRDVATDGTKLDGIEALADVTDTANVTAAGALMDSELTDIASVKALNQGVATTDSPTFAGATVNGTVEFDGLSGTGAVTVTDILDQDDMSGNSATALATQQSIKAYVDSQVATSDTLAEVLANGNATGGTDVAFGDNDKALFGAGNDLSIYHDGSNSYISETGTGNLIIGAGAGVFIKNRNLDENLLSATQNGSVQLFYDNAEKLATSSTGIDVTGTVTADGGTFAGATSIEYQNPLFTIKDTVVGGSGGIQFKQSTDAETGRIATTDADLMRFYTGSAVTERMEINSTGIDVTGSVTADSLTVDGNISSTQGGTAALPKFTLSGSTTTGLYTPASNSLAVTTAGVRRATFKDNGDIEAYEDTGTTPKLFWDASAESLGIGTTSPAVPLDVNGDIYARSGSIFADEFKAYSGSLTTYGSNTAALHYFKGNVGIGESSPAEKLEVAGNILLNASNAEVNLRSGITGTSGAINWTFNTDSTDFASIKLPYDDRNTTGLHIDSGYPITIDASGIGTIFAQSGSEKMRIDSSGNLLVGKTSVSSATVGFQAGQDGFIAATRASGQPLVLNRTTTDGIIADLQKDGSTVGSIGYSSGNFRVDAVGMGLHLSTSNVYPSNGAGGFNDNTINLGRSNSRFKDLYLSGGAYLGGTGSANHLDDYEEGTWTPNLRFGGTDTGITYYARSGKYTKVGNVVHVTCNFYMNSKASNTGTADITGLPFTSSSDAAQGGAAIGLWESITFADFPSIYPNASEARLSFHETTNGGVLTVLNDTNFTGAARISFSLTYITT